jgi:hypothetical protein
MTKPLPPWHMTPEQFGKSYPPVRTIGKANHPEWRYLPHLPARDTRVAAVQDAHRHFVERALEEGVAVPDRIAALYRPPPDPRYEPVQAEPDFLRLTAASKNEGIDAQARAASTNANLTARLVDTEDALKGVIGAALLAHSEAMTLNRTVATGLTKELAAQAEKTREMNEAMRESAEGRAAAIERLTATLADLKRQQARVLAASSKTPAKPKRWHFKIERDAHGNIAGLDAEPC